MCKKGDVFCKRSLQPMTVQYFVNISAILIEVVLFALTTLRYILPKALLQKSPKSGHMVVLDTHLD